MFGFQTTWRNVNETSKYAFMVSVFRIEVTITINL